MKRPFLQDLLWLILVALLISPYNYYNAQAQSTNASPYCQPTNQFQNCSLWIGIGRVVIKKADGTVLLDHQINCINAPGYGYFNNVPAVQLTPGTTYSWQVHALPNMTTSYTNQLAMWIDFNGNHAFEETVERITLSPNANNGLQVGPPNTWNPPFQSGTFTVPMGASPNVVRLRARTWNSMATTPLTGCSMLNYGMTVDFDVRCQPPLADPSPTAIALTMPGSSSGVPLPAAAGTYDLGFTLTNSASAPLISMDYDYTVTRVSTGAVIAQGTNSNWAGMLAGGSSTIVKLMTNINLTNPLDPLRVQVTVKNAKSDLADGDNNPNNNVLDGFIGP
ncbi:MAG: GEVED domain-containing protein, partial [Bacteroidetes bacterium]|nr:GEVED domain-containing protein [Bacteroidota bacterium]